MARNLAMVAALRSAKPSAVPNYSALPASDGFKVTPLPVPVDGERIRYAKPLVDRKPTMGYTAGLSQTIGSSRQRGERLYGDRALTARLGNVPVGIKL
jgi:hypothetical protein